MRKLAFTVGWKLVRWGNRNNKGRYRTVEYESGPLKTTMAGNKAEVTWHPKHG